jgi:hypothetical protein
MKMNKILVLAIASAFCGSVFAASAPKTDSCGLGWQVTDKYTYTATTTRATTNAIIPPVFGMTTGTLGCDQLEIGANDKQAADYVATNFEVLKTELAAGRGEYVDALAGAFGCKAKSAEVGAALQSNYDRVVAPAATPVELFRGIKSEIATVCI